MRIFKWTYYGAYKTQNMGLRSTKMRKLNDKLNDKLTTKMISKTKITSLKLMITFYTKTLANLKPLDSSGAWVILIYLATGMEYFWTTCFLTLWEKLNGYFFFWYRLIYFKRFIFLIIKFALIDNLSCAVAILPYKPFEIH